MRRRLFIAIDLPVKVKKTIVREIQKLKAVYPLVNFETEAKLHITVKFLGTTTIKPQIILANMQKKLVAFPGFEINFGETGIISHKHNILVVEIAANEALLKLFYMLNNSLFELGFKREKRRFYPHITLARLKQTDLEIPENINKTFKSLSKIQIGEIILYSSQLTKDGSLYTKEGSISLV